MNKDERVEVERRLHRSGAFQRVFRGKDGVLALKEIDEHACYTGSVFDADPYIHAYKAGQQSMAVFIHTVLEQDVDKIKAILEQESKNE